MGTTVLLVSLAAALLGAGTGIALRQRTILIMRLGGVVMMLAGLSAVAYALAEILPQFGLHTLDPLLLQTASWQGAVATEIEVWGTPVLVALAVAAPVAATLLLLTTPARSKRPFPIRLRRARPPSR